ncbi:MAG TPA: hypothetical protein VM364_16805 [Vicinamibacterales bacterium]|nr:hypothetical protein [Vicinamibacterales bacterium]
MDVEHVGAERDGADLGDPRGAVAAHETEQRVDAPHARPRQWTVEERGGIAADDLAGGLGLAAERIDIAHRVDTALDGVIARVDGLPARCLPRMGFDQQASHIEADDLRIDAGGDPLPDVRVRDRVERFVDGRELIAPDFRIAPQRNVVRRDGRRQQHALLLGLKVLERTPLRATVPAEAVIIEAPVASPRAGILDRDEHFARKAVIADAGYGSLDAALVTGRSHACRIDMKVARLGVLEEGRRDPRREGIGVDDDGLGVIGNEDAEGAAEKRPRRFTRVDRARRRFLEGRIDEAVA